MADFFAFESSAYLQKPTQVLMYQESGDDLLDSVKSLFEEPKVDILKLVVDRAH